MTDTLALRLREALGPDYNLERELGGGGMSRVFVATERALGRRVVVKVLPPDLAAGVNKERFRREIQLAAQLQHPHVVPLLTAGERDDLLWFTMPFIEGESLRVTLDKRGKLPVREVLRILHNVVDALAYAHSRGVVHRDIKPGNILMSGSHAVVTDFGVAKALSAAIPIAGHTTSGMAIGTPAYMAPEQLAADPAADHRVDLYAVGLLAYELLTGTAPFSGTSPQATLAAQLTVRPTAPHITQPDIPASLSAVIMQCLEKDANKRPETASMLLEKFDAVSQNVTGEIERASQSRSSRALMAIALLLVVGTVAYTLLRPSPDSSTLASATRDSTNLVAEAPAETLVVYRDVPAGSDRPAGFSMPIGITPAESIAIAQTLRGRDVGAGGSATSNSGAIDRDSLIAEVSKIFADSMQRALARMETALVNSPRQQALQALVMQSTARALAAESMGASIGNSVRFEFREPPRPPGTRAPLAGMDSARVSGSQTNVSVSSIVPLMAPPDPGTRRIALLPYRNNTRDTTLNALGNSLLASVDSSLRGSRRLEIVPASAAVKAFGPRPPNATAVGFALRANFVLSGVYFVRADSLHVVSVITDVQGGSGTKAKEFVVPMADAKSALSPTATWVRARLDSLRRETGNRPSSFEREPRQ